MQGEQEAQFEKIFSIPSTDIKFQDVTSLLKYLRTASNLRLRHSVFWSEMAIAIHDLAPALTTKEAIDALFGFSLMNYSSPSTTHALLLRIKGGIPLLSTKRLLTLLSIHDLQRLKDKTIIRSIVDVLQHRFQQLSLNDISSIMRYLNEARTQSPSFIRLAVSKFINTSSRFDDTEFLWFVKACLQLNVSNETFDRTVLSEISKRLPTMDLDIAIALTKRLPASTYHTSDVLNQLVLYFIQQSSHLSLVDIPKLCFSLVLIYHHIEKTTNTVECRQVNPNDSPLSLQYKTIDQKTIDPLSEALTLPSCYTTLYSTHNSSPYNNKTSRNQWGSHLTATRTSEETNGQHGATFFHWVAKTLLEQSKAVDTFQLVKIYQTLNPLLVDEAGQTLMTKIQTMYRSYLRGWKRMTERIQILDLSRSFEDADLLLQSFFDNDQELLRDRLALSDVDFFRVLRLFLIIGHTQEVLCCLDALDLGDLGVSPSSSYNHVPLERRPRPRLKLDHGPTYYSRLRFTHEQKKWDIAYGHRRRHTPALIFMVGALLRSTYPTSESFDLAIGSIYSIPIMNKITFGNHPTISLTEKYSIILRAMELASTEQLAFSALTCPNGYGSSQWIWEIQRRLLDPTLTHVFPYDCLPPLFYLLCETMTTSNQQLQKESQSEFKTAVSIVDLTVTKDTIDLLMNICTHCFPSLEVKDLPQKPLFQLSSLHSRSFTQHALEPQPPNTFGYNMTPNSLCSFLSGIHRLAPILTTLTHYFGDNSSLEPTEQTEQSSELHDCETMLSYVGSEYPTSTLPLVNDSFTNGIEDDDDDDDMDLFDLNHQSESSSLFINDHQDHHNDYKSSTTFDFNDKINLRETNQSYLSLNVKEMNANTDNTTTSKSLVPPQKYQPTPDYDHISWIKKIVFQTSLIVSDLLLARLNPQGVKKAVHEIEERIQLYTAASILIPIPTKTTKAQHLLSAAQCHSALGLPLDPLLIKCLCYLSKQLVNPMDLLTTLRLVSRSNVRDRFSLSLLGAAVDAREHQLASARLSQEIDRLCQEVGIEHLDDVAAGLINTETGGGAEDVDNDDDDNDIHQEDTHVSKDASHSNDERFLGMNLTYHD